VARDCGLPNIEPAGYLYRHYSPSGDLLYVGVTQSLSKRTNTHLSKATWKDFICVIVIEPFSTREELLEAERVAILNEFLSEHIGFAFEKRCELTGDSILQSARLAGLGTTADQLDDLGLALGTDFFGDLFVDRSPIVDNAGAFLDADMPNGAAYVPERRFGATDDLEVAAHASPPPSTCVAGCTVNIRRTHFGDISGLSVPLGAFRCPSVPIKAASARRAIFKNRLFSKGLLLGVPRFEP
jgi:GIY-YIG catalytic domain